MSARWILRVEYANRDQAQSISQILVNSRPMRWGFSYVNANGEKVWTEECDGQEADRVRL